MEHADAQPTLGMKAGAGRDREFSSGDVVRLQAGDLVPADLALVEARGLEVDEWELTGEIMPVSKRVGDGERVTLYHGSRVTRGSGSGVVIATGAETEYGRLARGAWDRRASEPPTRISRHFGTVVLVPLLAMVLLLIRDNARAIAIAPWAFLAILLALPSAGYMRHIMATRTVRRLAHKGIAVRDAECLEAIAHLDVVCFDKTGVLTGLDIQVRALVFPDQASEERQALPQDARGPLVGLACALCNDVYFPDRLDDALPVDAALIAFGQAHGFDFRHLVTRYTRVYDKPFDSEDRAMAAGFVRGNEHLWFAKGDPDIVLRMCSGYLDASGTPRRVDGSTLRSLQGVLTAARKRGEIVLGLAYSTEADMPPRRATFLCLLCLHNPLRPTVPGLVSRLAELGVRSVMLTGDRAETAVAVARQAGLAGSTEATISGKEMVRMPLQEVGRQAGYVSIFARLLPSQKGIVVRLLQQGGHHTVAMVGDGPNDTVALKVADVGVSFAENSSVLAQRAARVIIRDLADTERLLTTARRLGRQVQAVRVTRTVTTGLALVGVLVATLRAIWA